MNNNTSEKTPLYLIGAIFGLIAGFLAAHLYVRSVEENNDGVRPPMETMDVLRLGRTALTVMGQITELGAKGTRR